MSALVIYVSNYSDFDYKWGFQGLKGSRNLGVDRCDDGGDPFLRLPDRKNWNCYLVL